MIKRKALSIEELIIQTKFTRSELQFLYKGFKEVINYS
jgi:hypothetical protein